MAMMKDKPTVARLRSNSAVEPSSSVQQPLSSPRMSILPAVRLPSLRRQDDTPPPNQKTALLAVTLSSNTFLDTTVAEETSNRTLYQIKTVGTSTTVSRVDRREGSVTAASIKWPRMLPLKTKGKEYSDGVLIQMRGSRWNGGETLLRPPVGHNSTRKFNIPDYPHPMKWKAYGNTYWCTTPSVKGPIAILDLASGQDPTRLTVYETLHDKYDPKALSAVQGVSVLLLDYILVTALLLVTDLQEWMLVRKFDGNHLTIMSSGTGVQGPSSAPDMPPASDSQWRKIMYGEPIFPKLSSEVRSKNSRTSLSTSPTTPAMPRTPSSAGAPGFPYTDDVDGSSSRKMITPSLVEDDDDDDDDDDLFPLADTRPQSPSAESIHISGVAPSHTYIDPSFYGSPLRTRPPVPPLPTRIPPPVPGQYARSLNGRNFSSQPSTPLSATFAPPPMPSTPQSPRRPHSQDDNNSHRSSGRRSSRSDSIRSTTSYVSQSGTTRRRPLPRPPPVPPIDNAPPLTPVTALTVTATEGREGMGMRRVQSSGQLLNMNRPMFGRDTPPRPQRSLPPTPHDAEHGVGGERPAIVTGQNDPHQYPPSHTQEESDLTLVDDTLLRASDAEAHTRRPPITKASQEDLTQWVHLLTSPQRDLPPSPLPSSSIYDVPPPAYSTINFSSANPQNRPPVPATVVYPKVNGV